MPDTIPSDSALQPISDGDWLRTISKALRADLTTKEFERMNRLANRLDYLDKRMD